ncbi:MAG: methyltransferase type 11 [Deltaproteobacteria bacterium RBG_19FT_COMBO_60_16]|nr:MAG: methyltransferase type 11 [Deltaproteobacteria bacterium RBG_19FT_COMBO_60_16]
MTTPRELQKLYEQGMNISAFLRDERGAERNTKEIIELSYELQSGSYIAAMKDDSMVQYQRNYSAEIAKVMTSLCSPTSLLEAGVGEATTLSDVLKSLGEPVRAYGFDLSWSRVAYARKWLSDHGFKDVTLCTGDLLEIPFSDNSMDVVYTSHSIEPNRGMEGPILRELYRVAKKYLVLLEPGYELANDEAKERMDHHGFCRDIPGTACDLGYEVVRHELFPHVYNPLNPTAITIIGKPVDAVSPGHTLACPKYKTPLKVMGGMLFSSEALAVYPVVGGIPCLRVENGILACKYPEMTPER